MKSIEMSATPRRVRRGVEEVWLAAGSASCCASTCTRTDVVLDECPVAGDVEVRA
jgi:hypothetical protein